jgi:AAA domain
VTASVLPHSIELERAILNAPLEWGRAIPGIEPRDFFRTANIKTATAIAMAQHQGLPPEYQVIRQMLRDNGDLEDVGEVYLNDLAKDGVRPSDAALAANIAQLGALARKREAARLVIRYAQDPSQIDLNQLHRDLEALRIVGGVGLKSSFRTAKEIAAAAERVDWMLPGFLARGAITELVGKAKLAGKTSLIAYWVSCLLDGVKCFGAQAERTPVVYLTEQTHATFREVLRRGGLLEREDLSVLSYWDVKGMSWPAIATLAHEELKRMGASVLVVDTLSAFCGIPGEGENNSGDAQEALAPLQAITHHGYAVVVARHARKGGGDVGEDGRGSSAFTGGVDICLSLRRPEGNHAPTMRMLEGLSRYDETPAKIVINRVGRFCSSSLPPGFEVWAETYEVLGDSDAVVEDQAKKAIKRHVPHGEAAAVTMEALISASGIDRAALQRAMKKIPEIQKTGKGKRGDPHRYFFPMVSAQTSNPQGEHLGRNPFGANGEPFHFDPSRAFAEVE